MSDILKTNPTALHTCIYYEFLREKDVENAYKNFCGTVGDNVIDYADFEYWFYRFHHGNLDFDYDRSNDPKPLTLTDLPFEMINEIVGYLDLPNRCNARKVSRKFEKVVDRLKSKYDGIAINISKQEVYLNIENDSICYKKEENGSFVQCEFDEDYGIDVNIELSAPLAVLTNSKSFINCFWIATYDHETTIIMPKLIESLSKEVCPLFYAKRVELMAQHDDYVIQLLSLFQSGVLEQLCLSETGLDDDTFAKLVEMDQFKQLKSIAYAVFEPIPLSQFNRFSHLITFKGFVDIVSAEDIVILRDILSQFANLESAEISWMDSLILSEIGKALGIEYDNSEQITYRHPFSNSDKLFVMEIKDDTISVTTENN